MICYTVISYAILNFLLARSAAWVGEAPTPPPRGAAGRADRPSRLPPRRPLESPRLASAGSRQCSTIFQPLPCN